MEGMELEISLCTSLAPRVELISLTCFTCDIHLDTKLDINTLFAVNRKKQTFLNQNMTYSKFVCRGDNFSSITIQKSS